MELPLDILQLEVVLADAGYDSDSNRAALLVHGTKPIIKANPVRKTMLPFDRDAHKSRNRIELMFNKTKQSRRIATRYDKTRCSFTAFVNLAAMRIWLPTFVDRT